MFHVSYFVLIVPTMNICTLGYHDPEGARHWVIKQGLQKAGHKVIECQTNAAGLFPKYRDLVHQYWPKRKSIDVFLVPFPGHYIVPLAWLLRLFSKKPIVFDAFISLHDTLVEDRKLVSRWHPKAWLLRFIDWLSCALATVVLVDTPQHRDFFRERYSIAPKKLLVIHVGSRTDFFNPSPNPTCPERSRRDPNPGFTVLFCGSFIPLHGIETILQAASLLQKENMSIRLLLIGKGQLYPAMQKLAQSLQLKNTEFLGTKLPVEVACYLNNADIALGIFGSSDKAQRVIPHKVYDALACGVAVITGDTPAARSLLTHEKHAWLIPPNAEAIAQAIMTMKRNPELRECVAKNGHALFNASCTPERLIAPLIKWLQEGVSE